MRQNKEQILKVLERNRQNILGFGVKSLALFGSGARNDNTDRSDLDFVVEFEKKTFDAYMGLKEFLEELFECSVDLVLPNTIKPRLRDMILQEAVHAPGL